MARAKLSDEDRHARRKASKLAYYYRHRDKHVEYAARYHREHLAIRSAKGKANEAKNKERRRVQKKIYRAQNKARIAARYQARKEIARANCAANYVANAERIKAKVKAWRAANPDKSRIFSINKRARKVTSGGGLSRGLADRLMGLQQGKCACCRIDLRAVGYHLDHIEALSNGGSHTDSNIQLLCPPCNQAKHAKHPVEFMQSRGFLL